MAKLPRYEITIDPAYSEDDKDLGIDMVAFTSKPAIIVKGVAFNSHIKPLYFADQVKMRIVAPMLIPMQIYRRDEEDGYEYEVEFSAEVIEQLHVKMMQNLSQNNLFNLEHNAENKVPAFLLEAWIVDDPKTDKAFKTFGIEVPKGTLMGMAQLTDADYYKKLVDTDAVGFSIEGFLGMKEVTKLNLNSMKLPDGEHLIEDKIYVVKDGEVIEIKEKAEMAEEVVEEEVKEEAMAEEVVEEEVVEEEKMAVDPVADEEAILAIIQPKIDEVLALIAEVKSMIPAVEEKEEEEEVAMTKMSAHETLKSFMNFTKNK